MQPVLPGTAVEPVGQRESGVSRSLIPLDLVPQQIQDAGNGGQHRDPLPANGGDDLRGIEGIEKEGLPAKQGRDENARHLTKDMAEGQQAQEPDGMYRSRPFRVFPELGFEGVRLVSRFRWVSRIPLGAAVVPEVNTISAR